MVITERKGNELFIYINGSLAMKRWIRQGRSMVFNKGELPYTKEMSIKLTPPSVDKTEE